MRCKRGLNWIEDVWCGRDVVEVMSGRARDVRELNPLDWRSVRSYNNLRRIREVLTIEMNIRNTTTSKHYTIAS